MSDNFIIVPNTLYMTNYPSKLYICYSHYFMSIIKNSILYYCVNLEKITYEPE